jgi:hypothetical protein
VAREETALSAGCDGVWIPRVSPSPSPAKTTSPPARRGPTHSCECSSSPTLRGRNQPRQPRETAHLLGRRWRNQHGVGACHLQTQRRRRLLLARRARSASGTATQCTRRNDSPPPPSPSAAASCMARDEDDESEIDQLLRSSGASVASPALRFPPSASSGTAAAVETATYRGAVGVQTAGTRWEAATAAAQQLAVWTHPPASPARRRARSAPGEECVPRLNISGPDIRASHR